VEITSKNQDFSLVSSEGHRFNKRQLCEKIGKRVRSVSAVI
jgi:hypothetical protein